MARGVNKVILLGNVGGDPDVHDIATGGIVVTINIATSIGWKDKITGENKEATEWHRVVFYKKLAEIVAEHITKGSQVYVEGSLKTRKYKDKNGIERYNTEIVANEMQMLGTRPSAQKQPNTTSRSAYESNAEQFEENIPF